jgi:hypothetical protein
LIEGIVTYTSITVFWTSELTRMTVFIHFHERRSA